MKKPFTILAILVFAIVSLVHLLRLGFAWEVMVGGISVPTWASALGMVIAGGLAAGLWWESRK